MVSSGPGQFLLSSQRWLGEYFLLSTGCRHSPAQSFSTSSSRIVLERSSSPQGLGCGPGTMPAMSGSSPPATFGVLRAAFWPRRAVGVFPAGVPDGRAPAHVSAGLLSVGSPSGTLLRRTRPCRCLVHEKKRRSNHRRMGLSLKLQGAVAASPEHNMFGLRPLVARPGRLRAGTCAANRVTLPSVYHAGPRGAVACEHSHAFYRSREPCGPLLPTED